MRSYPDCKTKGTLIRSLLDGHNLEELCQGLPEELQEVVREPPMAGLWAPAVHNDALYEAICDLFYPTDEALIAWSRERTQSVIRNPLYKALGRVPSPAMILRMAERSHGLFQRGTDLVVPELEEGRAMLELHAPAHLHGRRVLLANVPTFEGVLSVVGGRNTRCIMEDFGPKGARYVCTWE